ncbi:MAG: IclR family transcriptional regulator [Chloroflexota bacterium]
MADKYPGTQAVTRAIHLLKLFDDDKPVWSLNDLSETAQLNKTTTFRILSALEHEGLLRRTPEGNYRLGSEMVAMGGRAMRSNELRTVSHAYIRELSQTTKETVTLETLHISQNNPRDTAVDNQWHMLVIDETLSQYRVGISQFIGSRLPVYASSTGRAVLAHLPEEMRVEYLTFTRTPFTDNTVITQENLKKEIQKVRKQGFAIVKSEIEVGLIAVGAPIFDLNGEVRSAISVVVPSFRVKRGDLPELAKRVVSTASDISHRLGYRR